MAIKQIHTFLVHPSRGEKKSKTITGATVPLTGRMFELLKDIYEKSDHECNVDISFRPNSKGQSQNDCRDLIVAYQKRHELKNGHKIAERLGTHTDGRSGLGLLFLIAGKVGGEHKIVLSRFPTDSAIYVDENPSALSVQFLERVFMKNKTSYKAVVYQHASLQGGFWTGRAIDKQLNPLSGEPSNYWISDFLLSDFRTTPETGTRRLALAIRDAVKKSSLPVKQELTAAATLAAGMVGQRLSINDFCKRLSLSKEATAAIMKELKSSQTAQEIFEFHGQTYSSLVAYKSIELNNGALLTASSDKFDDVFRQEPIEGMDRIRITTEGAVVDERIKTSLKS